MTISLKPETTRVEALKHLGEVFRAAGIETAQRDARLLLLDAAKINHAELLGGARTERQRHLDPRLTTEAGSRDPAACEE